MDISKIIKDTKIVSDGNHTFEELYEHRHALTISLMLDNKTISWKSKLHDDGTMHNDMFIAGIYLPTGNITYHIPVKYWNILSGIKTLSKSPKWDGHTSNDVLTRLKSWNKIK